MDCRTCQLTLIDLLHGELATDVAEDARAHLRQCASCTSAYERLAAGQKVGRTLDLAEPPAAVTARILEMAEAHARATVARHAAARSTAPNSWRSLLDFVSRFAMARQVGMVTISLLIVAVGLLSLPRRGAAPSGVPAIAGGTVLNPETAEEALPTGGVRPADRLPLKMDARSGRILSKDELAPAPQPASVAAAVATPAPKEAAQAQAQATAEKKAVVGASRTADEDGLDRIARRSAPLESARKLGPEGAAIGPRAKSAGSALGGAAVDDLLAGYTRSERPAPAKPQANVGASSAPSAFPRNDSSGVGALASGSGSARQRETAADKASAIDAEYAAAPATAAPAAPPPRAVAEGKAKSASTRDCGPQSTRYEQAVGADPTSLAAGQAMIALAECRTALGQRALARPLLERATRIAGVAARARALLSESEAAQPAVNASVPVDAKPGR